VRSKRCWLDFAHFAYLLLHPCGVCDSCTAGYGMVEVKNAICGAIPIPSFCRCDPSGRIGASVSCSVGIPLSGGLTIGAGAHFLPCGSPASLGYMAWIGTRTLVSYTWERNFAIFWPLPAPPTGFSIGVASITTRAELSAVISSGRIQASVAIGACGSVLTNQCCNTDCPMMSRAPLPVTLFRGSYDFSRFC
jgi:hypothetical protein